MLKSLKTFMAERGHGVNKLVTGIMKGIRFIFLFREILFKEALFCLPQANPWEHLEDVFLWKKKKRENHARSCNKPRTSGWQSSELLNSLYAIPRKHQFPEKLDMKAPLFICWGGNTRAPSPEARGMLFVHGFLRDTSLDSQHVPQKHQWRGSEEHLGLTEPYKINAHLVSPHLANQVRQPQPHLDLLAHTEDGWGPQGSFLSVHMY